MGSRQLGIVTCRARKENGAVYLHKFPQLRQLDLSLAHLSGGIAMCSRETARHISQLGESRSLAAIENRLA